MNAAGRKRYQNDVARADAADKLVDELEARIGHVAEQATVLGSEIPPLERKLKAVVDELSAVRSSAAKGDAVNAEQTAAGRDPKA